MARLTTMHPGNLILISPAIYLMGAAIVVLLLGVIASRKPDGKLEHFLPAQYLAPCLTVPALVLASGVIWLALKYAGVSQLVHLGADDHVLPFGRGGLAEVPALGLFVTAGGHAQLMVDGFAAILSFVAIAATLIVMLLSIDHFGEFQNHKAEYYALLMLAAAAASLATAASDLIAIYLSIEFVSLVSYALAAYAKSDRRSAEAGLKYFLYGAACSAIMLYGMSILFGATGGNTSLGAIARGFAATSPDLGFGAAATGAGWVGIMFVLVGLGFKLALVPFQFWAPDVYEGAPTPVTAFVSVVSKAAGLAVLVRFVMVVAVPDSPARLSWYWILVGMSALSMLWGNLVAISQTNIKRMLAYSSIAQVGYMMVGVLAEMHLFAAPLRQAQDAHDAMVRVAVPTGTPLPWGLQGVIIFLAAYLLMNLGAFAVVTVVGRRSTGAGQRPDDIANYAGLMRRSPFYAASLTVFFASLAGIPPTAGFLGKFFVFGSAIRVGVAGHPELVVLAALGVANSVISVYYYFNVVRLMFFAPGETQQIEKGVCPHFSNAAVVATLVLTLGLLVLANPVSRLASDAVYAAGPAIVHTPR